MAFGGITTEHVTGSQPSTAFAGRIGAEGEQSSRTMTKCRFMKFFRRKSKRDQTDLESRGPRTGIKVKDLTVLNLLTERGADLSQPRHVLYYLYFDSEQIAQQGAEIASARGFDVAVDEPLPDQPNQWCLTCQKYGLVLDAATVRGNGDFFEHLASQLGGLYDGWEASV